MVAALDDDAHVDEQHARYAARRTTLRGGAGGAPGFRIDHSEASLYLWATRDEDCWETVAWLAEPGHPGRARRLLRPRRRAARPGRVHRHRRAHRGRCRPAGEAGPSDKDARRWHPASPRSRRPLGPPSRARCWSSKVSATGASGMVPGCGPREIDSSRTTAVLGCVLRRRRRPRRRTGRGASGPRPAPRPAVVPRRGAGPYRW